MIKIIALKRRKPRESQSMLEYIMMVAALVLFFIMAQGAFGHFRSDALWKHFQASKYFITNSMDGTRYGQDR